MPNLISSEGLHWKVDFYCGCLIAACCGLLLINLIGHILHSAFPRTAQYSTEAGKCFTALIVQKWCVHRCERKIGVELGKIEVELGRFGVNLHKYYSPSLLPNSVHSLLVHFKLCTLHLFLSQQCTPSSLPMCALPLVSCTALELERLERESCKNLESHGMTKHSLSKLIQDTSMTNFGFCFVLQPNIVPTKYLELVVKGALTRQCSW